MHHNTPLLHLIQQRPTQFKAFYMSLNIIIIIKEKTQIDEWTHDTVNEEVLF